jgi:uncharacterized membrane protein YccC
MILGLVIGVLLGFVLAWLVFVYTPLPQLWWRLFEDDD